jgi:hypothetical protein
MPPTPLVPRPGRLHAISSSNPIILKLTPRRADLVDFCGLPCDDNVLPFHANKGAAQTASNRSVDRSHPISAGFSTRFRLLPANNRNTL